MDNKNNNADPQDIFGDETPNTPTNVTESNEDSETTNSNSNNNVQRENSGPLETTSSIIVIVSTANNSNLLTANNARPNVSTVVKPPEYSTIMNVLGRETLVPKYVQTTFNQEIQITPAPVRPTVIIGSPPLIGAPPSYAAIMRIGPPDPHPSRARGNIRIQPSPPFIAPHPPPSYAETQGLYRRSLHRTAVEDYIWGTEPLNLTCPSCAHMINTLTYTHRSNLTHFSALILFMCGCWPCCLLPYCMKSCKTTHHYCPDCQTYLGMYTPW